MSAVEKAVRMYIKEHPKDELFVVAAGGKQYVRVTIEQFSRLED